MCVLTPSPAPSAPQSVTASAASFSCMDVSWTPPLHLGGDAIGDDSVMITRYHITWGVGHTIEDATTTNYRVTGLTPETSYTIIVTAENNCNMISPAAMAMVTTEGTELL